ncbi:putative phage abortive infection protein [Enterococcus faecium]
MNEGKDFFSKKWVKVVSFLLIIVFALAVIPWCMQMLINQDSIAKGTYWMVRIQIKSEKEARVEEKVDNTFFNLLSLHNEQLNNLKKQDVFKKIHKDFEAFLNNALLEAGRNYLENNFDKVTEVLNDIKKEYELFLNRNENKLSERYKRKYKVKWKQKHEPIILSVTVGEDKELLLYSEIADATKHIIKIEKIINNNIDAINGSVYAFFQNIKRDLENLKIDVPDSLNNLIDILDRYSMREYDLLTEDERRSAIEEALSSYHSVTGSYFRLFHRIIKYINDNVKDVETKNNYLGFLRSTINQEEMFVIFYNAAYTNKGNGLLKELQKTTFFGDTKDLEVNQHFDTEDLFWEEDKAIMLGANPKKINVEGIKKD